VGRGNASFHQYRPFNGTFVLQLFRDQGKWQIPLKSKVLSCRWYRFFSKNSGFFDNDALVIDFSKTSGSVNPEDLGRLLAALPSCRLKPIAFRNGNPDVVAASLALGLIEVPADLPRATTSSRAAIQAPVEVIKEVVTEVVREIPGPPTMVLDKPLRSGQKVYARGSDLVVLAMVNHGAEVVADGNIHVYAPLRGKAMAGASGNTEGPHFFDVHGAGIDVDCRHLPHQ
jgi:septum site-determining protein MinC